MPRDYALAGRFFYNADYGPYSAFPSNYEALTTASLVLFDEVVPARVLNALLALNPEYKADPNSIDVGDVLRLSASAARPSAPAAPVAAIASAQAPTRAASSPAGHARVVARKAVVP